jgi:hypothetical protein
VTARRGFWRRFCAGIERGDNAGRRATTNLGTPAGQPTTAQTLAFSAKGGSRGVADSLWRAGGGGGSRGDARNDRGHRRREAGCCGGARRRPEGARRTPGWEEGGSLRVTSVWNHGSHWFGRNRNRNRTKPNQTNTINYLLNQIKPLKASNHLSPIQIGPICKPYHWNRFQPKPFSGLAKAHCRQDAPSPGGVLPLQHREVLAPRGMVPRKLDSGNLCQDYMCSMHVNLKFLHNLLSPMFYVCSQFLYVAKSQFLCSGLAISSVLYNF